MRRKPSLCQNLAMVERCICAQLRARTSLKQILPSMTTNRKTIATEQVQALNVYVFPLLYFYFAESFE
jgi:hypothetical protein